MITSDIGFALCRIASVYFFVVAARGVSWVTLKAYLITGEFLDFILSVLFISAPAAIAGALLWKYSGRISKVPDEPGKPVVSTQISTSQLLQAGVFLVGLYAVLTGLAKAVDNEALNWMTRSVPLVDSDYQKNAIIQAWIRRAGSLLQVALGLGLIYWREWVVEFASKGREQ